MRRKLIYAGIALALSFAAYYFARRQSTVPGDQPPAELPNTASSNVSSSGLRVNPRIEPLLVEAQRADVDKVRNEFFAEFMQSGMSTTPVRSLTTTYPAASNQ